MSSVSKNTSTQRVLLTCSLVAVGLGLTSAPAQAGPITPVSESLPEASTTFTPPPASEPSQQEPPEQDFLPQELTDEETTEPEPTEEESTPTDPTPSPEQPSDEPSPSESVTPPPADPTPTVTQTPSPSFSAPVILPPTHTPASTFGPATGANQAPPAVHQETPVVPRSFEAPGTIEQWSSSYREFAIQPYQIQLPDLGLLQQALGGTHHQTTRPLTPRSTQHRPTLPAIAPEELEKTKRFQSEIGDSEATTTTPVKTTGFLSWQWFVLIMGLTLLIITVATMVWFRRRDELP